jgi:F0F1-type ATP synthase epsilon subunit
VRCVRAAWRCRCPPLCARSAAPCSSWCGVAPCAGADLHLSLAVPSRVLVNNKVVSRVTLPGRGGVMGVERGVPPFGSELKPGVILVEYEKGEAEKFFVPVGVCDRTAPCDGAMCAGSVSAAAIVASRALTAKNNSVVASGVGLATRRLCVAGRCFARTLCC